MNKAEIIIYIAIISIGLFEGAMPAYAAPVVTGISGTMTNGSTFTVTGTGFGTKTTATPLKWDNFENGTLGYAITSNGWTPYGGTPYPLFSNYRAYGQGIKSALQTLVGGAGDSTNFKGVYWDKFGVADEIYVSLYFYWDTANGNTPTGSGVFKWIRANTNAVYAGVPAYCQQFQPDGDGGWLYELYRDGVTEIQKTMLNVPIRGAWHRMEIYWKLSTPGGTASGMVHSWVDLKQNFNATNVVTRLTGDASSISSLLLPFMASLTLGHGLVGVDYKFLVDDVYIDTTQSRVEICDSTTWPSRTHCDVQIPAAWSGSAITVTLNKGSFANFSSAYLYVVDASGNVNANGYLLSSAPTPDTTPPAAPRGIVVK